MGETISRSFSNELYIPGHFPLPASIGGRQARPGKGKYTLNHSIVKHRNPSYGQLHVQQAPTFLFSPLHSHGRKAVFNAQGQVSGNEMRESAETKENTSPATPSRNDALSRNGLSHFTTSQTILASVSTTAATLVLLRLYKLYLRRIPSIDHIRPKIYRKGTLYGYVTSVGDGDNFRLFHTPGGRLAGWGWLPRRREYKNKTTKLYDQTLHVRIAGVDAPEMAHFGRPAQPYSQEAIQWLRSFILHRYVRVYPYRRDQYDRVVCTVYRPRWLFFRSDVGLNMIRTGLATVYEAKTGSEFGNKEQQYRDAEQRAKQKKIGMWQEPGLVGRLLGKKSTYESPREYKTRMAKQDLAK